MGEGVWLRQDPLHGGQRPDGGNNQCLLSSSVGNFLTFDMKDHKTFNSPDNCAVDISAGEDLGHVAEQPEDQSGELRLIHHGCPPGHHRPLELRNLEMIVM